MIAPAIYTGVLRHRRFLPRRHTFEYRLFMSLLDIDHVAEAMQASRWTSYNAFNWMSFDDRDHLRDFSGSLRDRLTACARADGRELPDGKVFLLTHLRYAGYVFNPISLYYCHDRSSALRMVMADVRNTYGGRRQYWLDPRTTTARHFVASTPRTLFVSPFMHGEMNYEFVVTPPASRLVVHMNVDDRVEQRRHFDATLALSARPWTAASIRTTLLRYPLMTAKVIGAIHWEALRLRWKRFPEQSPVRA